ncbi:efflux RND transporter periplasmic adaptor subunit [Desulfosporosinus sp. BG]|uniref:HlyD family secretion protein n=1 Tax=Desulfosporosinus sp. BG TaxID=1633135 RepID=UPI00083AF1DE|nr:efflux RND transporter periplasmic adaptor subunit [Desulfosporosinus sp. BG]ODA39470.1 Multidrug resistance efflux pump, EmrA [Desulfosporosinus sp. BG]
MRKIGMTLVALCLLLSGCGTTPVNQNSKQVSATDQSQDMYIMAGRIESEAQANVAAKISARVSKLAVDVGDKVTQGQPLIYLDNQDVADQVKQAQAAVDAAQANLDKALIGAPEQLAQAQAKVDSAKVNYDNAKVNLDRNDQLFQAGSIPKQQLEAAQGQFATVDTAYKNALSDLALLNKGQSQNTIDNLQALVNQSQAALGSAQVQLSNGTIVAPVSGTVSQRNIHVGEMAAPNVTLLSIVGGTNLFVNAKVPTDYLSQLKEGQKVSIMIDELPDKSFKGSIAVISPVVDFHSKQVEVKVTLDNNQSLIKPGMMAEIGISNTK